MLLANVANLLSTEQSFEPKHFNEETKLYMTDQNDHLVWFLQISDIHVSVFRDSSRISEFRQFCENAIQVFKPPVVLASGDLTDAKTKDSIGSRQFRQEWVEYRNVLTSLNVSRYTTWLDIRGNHDNFNVLNSLSKQNFYINYSIQGKANPRSYLYQIEVKGDIYSFVAIDACRQPGPRRPFNFVGVLDEGEIAVIRNIVKRVEASHSKYTIWFGHFPTSCILSHEPGGLRSIIGRHDQALAYLCGHLHTLGGLIPKMYTLQQDGFLELELGDWKDNRMYRLLAVDHGMLSFIDIKHQQWPVVLITNPKDALFLMPRKENFEIVSESTHVRILAFSPAAIESVEIQIDDEAWVVCRHVEGPLYVAPWSPKNYKIGLHTIKGYVRDVDGRTKFHTQPFSLEGRKLSFELLPKLVLMTNASTFFKCMFWTFNLLAILPLMLLRVVHYRAIKKHIISRTKGFTGCFHVWIRKLWTLSSVDRIFWPTVLYPIYLTVGPWSVGFIVEERLGAIFAWGIYVDGVFLPGSFTYAYGFLQMFTFQMPLIFILANGVDFRVRCLMEKVEPSCLVRVGLHLPFIGVLTLQVIMAYFFWLAYGTLAFLLGMLRTWSIVLAVILWVLTLRLPERCAWGAGKIWSHKCEQELASTSNADLSAFK